MLATAACGGASDQGAGAAGPPKRLPASIAKYAGDAQVVPPGTRVPVLPTVIVRDANGLPLAGAQVDFVALDGSGVGFESPTRTDSLGLASVMSWTSGSTPGSVDSLQAEVNAANVPGNPVYFTLSIPNPLPTDLVIVSGDSQVAFAGQFVQNLKVRLMTGNQPRPYDTLDYAATKGGGGAIGATTTTDDAGFATILAWRLGPYPGQNELTITARRSASPKVTAVFHATGTLVPPRFMSAWAGLGQTAEPGTPVAYAPSVSVQDSSHRGVIGAHVRFRATAGGAPSDTVATTDANGIAAVAAWTLGPVNGTDTLFAEIADSSAATLPPVVFTARAAHRSAVPSTIQFISGFAQVDTVGKPVTVPPSVAVRDSLGFGVAGLHVVFSPSSGSTVTGGDVVTDTAGVATVGSWTLGTVPRQYLLTATVSYATRTPLAASIGATALPAVPTVLEILSGDNQEGTAGAPVPVNPTVIIHTDDGTPVAGVPVIFLAASGGGSVLDFQVATDSLGHASPGTWTLGSPGTNTLTATALGIGTVTFHATAH